jgi:hypothetical protein
MVIAAIFMMALTLLPGCISFRIKSSTGTLHGIARKTKLQDIVTTAESTLSEGSMLSLSLNDLQNTLIIVSGLAYYLYENRPRGNARDDLLEIRKSARIPNNLGVFAKTFIPTGTVIGEYPGYVKTFESLQKSSKFNNSDILYRNSYQIFFNFCARN